MDELHAIALEEIALEGKRGCSLGLLWQLLQPRLPEGVPALTPHIKRHLWKLLISEDSNLTYSTEQLMEQAREAAKEAGPAKKKRKKKQEDEEEPQELNCAIMREAVPQALEQAEAAGIVMVASESARLSVVGVYDELEAKNKLSEQQLGVLEMVGQGRHHGAVQTDMANALGVQHRNFFYVLKMLEARHMIVRNKLMVPLPASSGWSLTSIVHLPRYAPQVALGSEAVFKEVQTAQGQQLQLQGSGQQQQSSSGTYAVRDDTTIMQQICDFLAAQSARYVSESQVKALLGFTGSAKAHRQWRRLRGRLVKIGCIAAEPGMLGDKAISVLRLIKPYKVEIPVVVDSDEDGDREAAGGDDDEGGDDADEEGNEAAEGAAAAGGAKMFVEVGRDQMLLEVICGAGPEGILTPDLSRKLGVGPKVLLKAVPDMCKRFGVRVDYDMPQKALTNHVIAPQHLLDKYAQQQHLLLTAAGQTPPPLPPPADGEERQQDGVQTDEQQRQLSGDQQPAAAARPAPAPMSAQERQAAALAAVAAALDKEQRQEELEAAAAIAAAAAAANRSSQPSKGQKRKGDDTAAAVDASAAAPLVAAAQEAVQDTADAMATERDASLPAAGNDDESETLDLDTALDAAIARHMPEPAPEGSKGSEAAGTAAGQTSEAAAAASMRQQPAAAAAGATGGGSIAAGSSGRRLAGLSTQHPGYLGAAARPGVQAAPVLRPSPSEDAGALGPMYMPGEDAVAAAAARMPWLKVGGQGSISRLQQRRMHVIMARLLEVGFVMKQEMRRLIVNVENPVPQNTSLFEYSGPDSKTCNRIIALMVQHKAAKLVKLQYKLQEHILDTKEVEVLLLADTEETPELLQRIAAYDQALPGNLRRDGMRRALEAQGVAAAAAARVAAAKAAVDAARAAGSAGEVANAEAIAAAAAEAAAKESQLRVVDGEVTLLGGMTRSLPGFGRRPGLGLPLPVGRGKGRRKKRSTAPVADAEEAAAESDEEDEQPDDSAAAAAAAAGTPAPTGSDAAGAAAPPTATKLKAGPTPKQKGAQDIMQMHRNGYIPSLMQRCKLLHQYLCACVKLSVEPHEDIPTEATDPAGSPDSNPTLSFAGQSEPDRPENSARFQFQLANPEQYQQQPKQDRLLLGDSDGFQAGVFEFKRRYTGSAAGASAAAAEGEAAAAAGAGNGAAAAAAGGEGAAGADSAADIAESERQHVEQQLGGRLLSVTQFWMNMPLSLALQVAGSHLKLTNLIELLDSSPAPLLRDFSPEDLNTVFGSKAWRRLLLALSPMARMKLLTPVRKGETSTWQQSHLSYATHLVLGTQGVLDVPTEDETAQPASFTFDFTKEDQWGEYWAKMQSLYDTNLLSISTLQRFFPASAVLDVARHRCWALSFRSLPLLPFLKVQARLEGLPVEQLDMHMARQVSDELGQPYAAVQQFVTRLRTELNEAREKAGLERIYLLGKGDSSQLADRNTKDALRRQAQLKERQRRRAKQEKRRLRRQRRLQRKAEGLVSESSESDSESEPNGEGGAGSDWPFGDVTGDGEGTDTQQKRKKKRRSKSRSKRGSSVTGGEGTQGEDGGSGSDASSSSALDTDEEVQRRLLRKRSAAAAAVSKKMMPRIIFQLAPEDRPAASAAAHGEAAGDSWGSDGDRVTQGRSRGKSTRDSGFGTDGITTDGGIAGTEGVDSDGGDAVPNRIAQKARRHKWTPQQDRQLLRWVAAQRIELGTRGSVRWASNATGLPLSVPMCTRRFNFLKKHRSSSLFIASLEAQAIEIHKDFAARRTVLQQQLSRLQQESKLSVNPLLLQRQPEPQKDVPAAPAAADAAGQEQQQHQTPGLVPEYLQPSAAGAAAEAAAAPPAASAGLSIAGPHKVTLQGNIILLPDESMQEKLDRLLSQVEEFTTPRYRPQATKKRGDGTGDQDESLGRQLQRRRRRRRQQEAADAAGMPHRMSENEGSQDEDLLSSGESDDGQEEGWLTPGISGQRLPKSRRSGSRHVRPLRTMADRVARSNAILAAAAAAAAAIIAQRRAAGEQFTAEAEERERQQQLQAALKGGRRRLKQQRKQQSQQVRLSAISGPRDLIQSWRKHHKGVETRTAKPAAVGTAADAAEQERSTPEQDQADAAATADREATPAPSAAEDAADAAAAASEAAASVVTAAGATEAGAVVVAASPSWMYGPVPTTPVVTAMHLITSLLHLVATEGSLPPDASLALLLRFNQAEVAAAFRWLRALGWLNSGAARRPFQLSTAWIKRLRGEAVLTDLLDRTPAATLALMKLGLVGSGATVQPVAADSTAEDLVGDSLPAAAPASGSEATAAVASTPSKLQQLLELQVLQLERKLQQRAAAVQEPAAAGGEASNAGKASKGTTADADQASKQGPEQEEQQPGRVQARDEQAQQPVAAEEEQMDVDSPVEDVQQQDEQGRQDTAAAVAAEPAEPAARDAAAAPAQSEPDADPASSKPSPCSLSSCVEALHPVAPGSSSFWVGWQPGNPGAVASLTDRAGEANAPASRPQPLPGALLMQLVLSAAAGQLELSLHPTLLRHAARAGGRGEAAPLFNRVPQLLVQVQPACRPATGEVGAADAAAGLHEEAVGVVREQAPAERSAGNAVQLVPQSTVENNTSSWPLLAYAGGREEQDDVAIVAGGEEDALAAGGGEASAAAPIASDSRKRMHHETDATPEEEAPAADEPDRQEQHTLRKYVSSQVGKDSQLRQQAEEACLLAAGDAATSNAATAGASAGAVQAERVAAEQHGPVSSKRRKVNDSTYTAGAPVKKQREMRIGSSGSSSSSSSVKPPAELVRVLLAAVRDAGPVGVSVADLQQQLITAAGTGGADAEQGTETQEGRTGDLASPDAEIYAGIQQAAASTELKEAFAALPAAVLQQSAAASTAAISASLALLHRYGLIRKVPGWQHGVWVSVEHSMRLLAWPVPEQTLQSQMSQQASQQEPQQHLQDDKHTAADAPVALPAAREAGAAIAATETTPAAEEAAAPAVTSAGDRVVDKQVENQQQQQQQQPQAQQQRQRTPDEVLVAPWLDHKGRLNQVMWRSLVKKVMGLVLRNPGIPEPLLLAQMDVISPAAVKNMLAVLAQQQHLITRAVHSSLGAGAAATSEAGAAAAGIASGEGGWHGQGAALRLGTALTSCAPAPAKPPSLLLGKKTGRSAVEASGSSGNLQHAVLHYWPSLLSSTTSHLTCMPCAVLS